MENQKIIKNLEKKSVVSMLVAYLARKSLLGKFYTNIYEQRGHLRGRYRAVKGFLDWMLVDEISVQPINLAFHWASTPEGYRTWLTANREFSNELREFQNELIKFQKKKNNHSTII